MPTKVTAQERYTDLMFSITHRLSLLCDWCADTSYACAQADHPGIDWRDVGDAAHIDDLLAMACEFLEDDPEGARWLAAHRNDV